MSKLTKLAAFCLILFVMAVPALAQDEAPAGDNATPATAAAAEPVDNTILNLTAIGAGLVLIGGGYGISRIGSSAVESMARQPEAASAIQTAMIIAAALIEGATFFALIVCWIKI